MRRVMPASARPDHAGRRALVGRLGALAACTALPGITVAAAQARVVCVGGALTEIACALDAGHQLVGVDSTSQFPQSVRSLPSVGYARTLAAEGILALAPTLVVATEDAGPPAVLRQLASAGVPVEVLPARHRIEGLLERVRRLGVLLDRRPQAARLEASLRADWDAARRPVLARAGAGPRVLFVLAHTPGQAMVSGQGTAADAMLQYAGARNAVQGDEGYKPLAPEAVVAAAPDILLATEQGLAASGGVTGLLALPGVARTPAGSERRVLAIEASLLLGFGPRLPQALQLLDGGLRRQGAA